MCNKGTQNNFNFKQFFNKKIVVIKAFVYTFDLSTAKNDKHYDNTILTKINKKMKITDTYLVALKEADHFKEVAKKCGVELVDVDIFDTTFDQYTITYSRAGDLIQLGSLLILEQLNKKES